ncbi:hypothetical protein Ddye_027041 [Dipteronia dyeriana]|uniref:F-box domain-containing protein n=1 Tax=Dipteronia dyeriana TaxID=168575 RepID=A0AAD9TNZ7_9ROSI|nr:hypothetical protein Ddye_027041 [Dipteronia dyeriana]
MSNLTSAMTYSFNKKRKISQEKMQKSSSSVDLSRRWEDLKTDILVKIFETIPLSDLSHKVVLVCHSWQLVCWHILCWQNGHMLDLGIIRDALIGTNVDSITGKFGHGHQVTTNLMKLLKSLLEGDEACGYSLEHWRSSIRHIWIPIHLQISNEHLVYIAER